MKYWQINRNYRKFLNADGTYTYIITVDGEDVQVDAKLYRAYAKLDRRRRYLEEQEAGIVFSLNRLEEDKVPPYRTGLYAPSAEEVALRNMQGKAAMDALYSLGEDDRQMIEALVLDGVTEQEYAGLMSVTQVAIHKRKKRIQKLLAEKIEFGGY